MKNIISWKLFFTLLAVSVIAAMLALPYTISLSPMLAKIASPALVAGAAFQSIIFFSIAIFVGLLLAPKVGLTMPILEGLLYPEKRTDPIKPFVTFSIGMGILSGILILALSLLFPDTSLTFLKAESAVTVWKGFLASFYGGIGEEVLLRLFVMTLLVWITFKIKKTPEGLPTNTGIWVAIILSSIIFGLGHLGITSDITAITPLIVFRAVLLNGVPGVIFGWLYWKKGLESAILAHFSADIVIHVITPLVASLFLK